MTYAPEHEKELRKPISPTPNGSVSGAIFGLPTSGDDPGSTLPARYSTPSSTS
jgi:hypothetical protein